MPWGYIPTKTIWFNKELKLNHVCFHAESTNLKTVDCTPITPFCRAPSPEVRTI